MLAVIQWASDLDTRWGVDRNYKIPGSDTLWSLFGYIRRIVISDLQKDSVPASSKRS